MSWCERREQRDDPSRQVRLLAPRRRDAAAGPCLATLPEGSTTPPLPRSPTPRHPEAPSRFADCNPFEQPCPGIGCRYHLLLREVRQRASKDSENAQAFAVWSETRQLGRPTNLLHLMTDDEVLDALESMPETCALAVADRGITDVEELAHYMGMASSKVYRDIAAARGALVAQLGPALGVEPKPLQAV